MNEKCFWCYYQFKIQGKQCPWYDEYTTYTNAEERIVNCEHFLALENAPLDASLNYINFPKDEEPLVSESFVGSIVELWDKIVSYLKDNCELPDSKLYDVLTAWLFASYVPEVWNMYPYLYLYGISGTGKTRLLFTLKDISYKGIVASNITSASLFRTVSKEMMTLFIDEYQPFVKGNPVLTDINQILDCGYKKGGQVIRTVSVNNQFVTQSFNVCGFKALDSTEMIPNALLSRSIFIRMSKAFQFYSQEKDEDTISKIKVALKHGESTF